MPCRDYLAEDQWRLEKDKEAAMVRASLCAVLTVLEDDDAAFAAVLKKIDWKEAGVTKREFLSWWEDHKIEDEQRRLREIKESREKKIRKDALAKLTAEEKKLLGIKS